MGIGKKLSIPILILIIANAPTNAENPIAADTPAYSAIVTGPLIFFSDASPLASFHNSFQVPIDTSQVLTNPIPAALKTLYLTVTLWSCNFA